MIVSVVVGPKFIAFLRRNEFGQHIREEGPEAHRIKQGTPTMGGLLILVVATIAFLSVSKYKVPALTVLFVTLGCGAIGFLDDFIKLTHRRSLGLRGRWKLVLLALITVGVGFAANHQHLPTSVFIPVVHWNVQLSYGWYVLLFLVIAGTTNGVNLADGIDGLAAGAGIISLITFTAIAVVTYIRSGNPGGRFDSRLDLAIVGAALIGATIGFLWYNAFPAEVTMGHPLRDRLRALLPGLHVLPTLTRIALDLGGGSLASALEQAGPDGDVIVVVPAPDDLARVRAGCSAPNVAFLLGNGDVLPLLDA